MQRSGVVRLSGGFAKGARAQVVKRVKREGGEIGCLFGQVVRLKRPCQSQPQLGSRAKGGPLFPFRLILFHPDTELLVALF